MLLKSSRLELTELFIVVDIGLEIEFVTTTSKTKGDQIDRLSLFQYLGNYLLAISGLVVVLTVVVPVAAVVVPPLPNGLSLAKSTRIGAATKMDE